MLLPIIIDGQFASQSTPTTPAKTASSAVRLNPLPRVRGSHLICDEDRVRDSFHGKKGIVGDELSELADEYELLNVVAGGEGEKEEPERQGRVHVGPSPR